MKSRTALVLTAVGMVAYVVLVIAVYAWHLDSLPIEKGDPAPWGQFGDYLGGLLNPVIGLLNVMAIAYIGITVQKLNELEKKKEQESEEAIRTAIELHREWNSESLYRSRTLAGKLVREFPTDTMLEIEAVVPTERAVHVWIVVGFFQRLAFLVQHEKIHRAMTLELFGELFVWWWIVSFERQLATCDWDARDRILGLKDWFYRNTTEAQREPWVRRARRDFDEAEEASKAPPLVVL